MPSRTTRLAAALLMLPLCLPSQEAEAKPAQRARPEAVIVSMRFPGGTMTDFVEALRRADPDVNIVMAPRAEAATVPPMELRGTGLEQALDTACTIAEGAVEVKIKQFRGSGAPVYIVLASERRRGGVINASGPQDGVVQSVFMLNPLTMDRAVPDSSAKSNEVVSPLSVETVLSAVELAASLDGAAPVLRYHKDSGLLVVRGSVEQVGMVRDTLRVLQEDLDRRYGLLQLRRLQERGAVQQSSAGSAGSQESTR